MKPALDGIRVVDLGISTAGPYGARFLGDLGAEVIKVEPLDGENARKLGLRYGDTGYLFHVNNYNKKSISLNVQSPKGRELFLELVSKSDVVTENFALGTMDRWGIGYDACRKANSSIIYCAAKGFGLTGPLAGKRAFDTVVQAMSGIMHLAGGEGEPPLKAGPSVCDLMTAVASAMAVVSAIAGRKPGESQLLDTALFDMGVWSLLPFWPAAASDARPSNSLGNGHPFHAPFGVFDCADGRLMVTVTTEAHWRALAPLLGLSGEWDRETRKAQEERIEQALGDWLSDRSAWEAAKMLQTAGVPAGPVLDVAQATRSEVPGTGKMLVDIDHPVYGPMPLIRTPIATGETGDSIRNLQPTLGEHNTEIVGDLLGHHAELDSLRAEGVIG